MQRTLRPAKGDVDLQRLLTAAEGAEGRHRPVQADQPQEAFDKPSLPWSLGPVAFPWLDLPLPDPMTYRADETHLVSQLGAPFPETWGLSP